jgi:hypothetical protein
MVPALALTTQEVDTSPGPGHYDLPTTWGRQGPAFSIAAKPHREVNSAHCTESCSDSSSSDGEGAAAGGLKRRQSRPSRRAKHKKGPVSAAAAAAVVGPGPGEYETCMSKWGSEGPAFSIRGRPRSPGKEVSGPGPGEHQQISFK